MVIYETEQDYLDDFDNHTLTPMKFFFVQENNQLGFATSNSTVILLAGFDQTAQFAQVNCTKIVCQGDVELLGVVKIDNEQALPAA